MKYFTNEDGFFSYDIYNVPLDYDEFGYYDSGFLYDQMFMDTLSFIQKLPEVK